jgi:sugar O-acyltransferase (sialic acid O-acetyltransferase NeuD family)
MGQEVILVGYFSEIVELCQDAGYKILGVIDGIDCNDFGLPVLGTDEDASLLFSKYGHVPLIITPDNPKVRCKLVKLYGDIGFNFISLISPNAVISKSAFIGEGVVIQNNVNISSFSKIGSFVKLNTNSNIMHDSVIGDYTTVAPNAVILGRVFVDEFCYIGSNATLLPSTRIGYNTTVGAGAVVTKNLECDSVYVGNPAKLLKK